MLNGLDYSMGMPDMATMKQGNVSFVCRYVGWSDLSQAKILTPQEAETLSQNGIAIVSNYEWYSSRPQEGTTAAAVDAARATAIHKTCGGPNNAPIYFSVDYNSPGSDVVEYFKTLGLILGLQRVGAYGGYDCIKYLFDNNLITWGWQTYAWSNGQWDSRAHIRQTQNSVQFGGIEVDFDTGMFDNIGQWKVGGSTVSLVLNSQGCVCDVVKSNQLFENEMELCGPWAIRALALAGFPGKGPIGTVEDIDTWVDAEVAHMGFTPANFPGSSIPDVENFLHDASLHYWEIKSDVGTITKAVRAGYPVAITANEQNIFWWNGTAWADPYDWKISANHVLPVVGIDSKGNFICADQLSSRSPWPVVYDATRINPSYAVVVRLPFLQAIPSGDPNTWPANFNAQQSGSPPPPTPTDFQKQQADALWGQSVRSGTGIYTAWLTDFRNGLRHGPPLGPEIHTVDWDGKPVILQSFAGALARWPGDGTTHWYSWS